MEYDEKVIKEFAVRLYSIAEYVIMKYCILGIIIVAAPAGGMGGAGSGIIGAIIGGAIGYFIGSEKAFGLKLQAQTALCQAQIERNTNNNPKTNTTQKKPTDAKGENTASDGVEW